MQVTRVALAMLTTAAAFWAADPAWAGVRAETSARAEIVDPSLVRLSWSTALPTVSNLAVGAGAAPTVSMGMMTSGRAMMLVRRNDGRGLVASAPDTFKVGSGSDDVEVRTGLPGDPSDDPEAFLVGAAPFGAAASIGVSRPAEPGAPLMIVVQFN